MSWSDTTGNSLYRFWHSVQFKVIFSLGCLFLVVISLLLLFSYQTQQKMLVETLTTTATDLNLSLQNSLELAMLAGQRDEIQFALDRIAADSHIANIFITDKDGNVRFSSDPLMIDLNLSQDSSACHVCHDQNRPLSSASFVYQGGKLLRTVSVIRNKPSCYTCHDAKRAVNGILYLDYTLSTHEKRIAANKKRTLLLAASSILLLSILSFLIFNGLFVKKIKSIIGNIHAVETEDKIQLQGDERDEFALINKSIQQMDLRVKESIQRIRNQRDFLQSIIDSVSDGLIVIDKNFRIALANKSFCRLIGKQPAEVVGCLCHEAMSKDVCGHVESSASCPSAEAFNRGANSRVAQAVLPGGKKLLLEITAYPLMNNEGDTIQSIEIIRDVTQKKQLEDELLQAEKMASIGRLASGIAHEINNPLATISTCADGMADRIKEAGDNLSNRDDFQKYLSKIDKCVYRCKNIIDRLLAFSHIKSEQKGVVDINEIVQETIPLLSHRLKSERKEIKLALSPDPVRIAGDSTTLGQLVLNLATNALDACDSDGRVTISTFPENSDAVLQVEDTGCGIPDGDKRRIFEPFFTTKGVGKGTGLGLSICQRIVSEHSGKIYVRSEMNKGSTFEVRIPSV